jgi:hypothetical protein
MQTNIDKNEATAMANTDPLKEYAKQQELQDKGELGEASETDATELVYGDDSEVDKEQQEIDDERSGDVPPLKTIRDGQDPADVEENKE